MLLKKAQFPGKPAGGGCLEQDGHKNSKKGDRCDDIRAGRPHPQEDAGKRSWDDSGLPGPAHEEEFLQAPLCSPVGERAEKNRERPGNKDENQDQNDAPA